MAEYNLGKETVNTGSGDSPKWEDRGQTGTGYVLNAGDTLNVNDWGTATNCTLNGGTVNGNSGGTINNATINSGIANIQGATVNGGTMNGGTMVVRSGTLSGTFRVTGGSLTIGNSNGVVGTNNTIINLSGSAAAAIYNVAAMTINLASGASLKTRINALRTLTINTTGENFSLDIEDLDPRTITGVTHEANRLIIHTTNGDVTINGSIPGYHFSPDGRGGLTLTACFAEGTLIATPQGLRRVETLRIGDMVETDLGPQPVRWVGYKQVRLHGAKPDEAHLIRIHAHAFGAGRPNRTLWVTPEHCVSHEGGLVPMRMLVNGGSIAYDRTRRSYTYYHIETPVHAILQAENLGMESYLPGLNAVVFDNRHPGSDNVPGNAHGKARLPLIVARDRIEPLWASLATRSARLGHAVSVTGGEMGRTDIRLVTAEGKALTRVDHAVAGQAAFVLPPYTRAVIIRATARRPDQVIGPFMDDRRRLGVRVGTAYVQDEGGCDVITHHLTTRALGGWHEIEDGDTRWTSDSAVLPLPEFPVEARVRHLILDLPDMV
ncbi:hypothetical protein C0V97_17260 [Asaia sp. W19]|uniref:Hint domain-containing protein n=2 Tax=unclassified Asaia TaxID=2685023 RepID=UPI000F8DE234|nr:Hint domain-containing protein [Asaia sp. W19]RUT24315.1 hypothetical protein C0V97_17260 [Asaia sp. W19]